MRTLLFSVAAAIFLSASLVHAEDSPTGNAACDDYAAKYTACIAKAPDNTRAAYSSELVTMTAQWKKLSANPANADMLTQSCTAATASAKKSMAVVWKCDF